MTGLDWTGSLHDRLVALTRGSLLAVTRIPTARSRRGPTTQLVAAAFLATGSLFLGPSADACGCSCPSAREVFGRADAVVIARFVGKASSTEYRYNVREWLKGDGPRRIVVSDYERMRPEAQPLGLALRHIEGDRYRALDCGHASADEARLVAEPWERPTGQMPAALFVATDLATARGRGKAGAWLDRSGRLVAWDEFDTRAFSVCPGGRLAVQAGGTPGWEAEEVRVRDLTSLEIVERIRLESVEAEDITCRDETAREILVLDEHDESADEWYVATHDARSEMETTRYDIDASQVWAELGRDAAMVLPDYPPRAVDVVDLDTGAVIRILETGPAFVMDYAMDASGDRAAILALHPDTLEHNITILKLSAGAPAAGEAITGRWPSNARTRREAWATLTWTDAGHVARISGRTGAVTLFDATDLSVDCEWQAPIADRARRDGWELMDHAAAGVLLGTAGTRLFAAHATGGPERTIHRFSPRPRDPVVALPSFDATALLGAPQGCPTLAPPATPR